MRNTNAGGAVYFSELDPDGTKTIKIFDAEQKERGVCKVTFQKSDETKIDSHKDLKYVVAYQKGTQDVYLSATVDLQGNSNTELKLKEASASPIKHEKETPKKDEKGHEKPEEVAADPCFNGYLMDQNGAIIAGAIIKSQNTDTKGTLNAVTNETGYFEISGIMEGNHSVAAVGKDDAMIGKTEFVVQDADVTGIVQKADGKIYLSIKRGADELYMNLRADGKGGLKLMDVSNEKAVEPDVSATNTLSPTPTETPVPQPEEQGNPAMVILIIVIAAAAAAVAVILVLRARRNRQNQGTQDDRYDDNDADDNNRG